jgi:hypothetical protein
MRSALTVLLLLTTACESNVRYVEATPVHPVTVADAAEPDMPPAELP